ncbi:Fe2OG dioxygenase domain-containing protein [Balamuthia mandrillaris]
MAIFCETAGLAKLCAEELGHPKPERVQASLYKLLLYEEGGFFKPHRDSEKEDGMFASLVVQLPCRYEGGELVVHHPRQQPGRKHRFLSKTFDLSEGAAYLLYRYVAFYADCPHEVQPVTWGYRLSLVYNLVTRPPPPPPASSQAGRVQRAPAVRAPENLLVVKHVQAILRHWQNMEHDAPEHIALMLDHQYSEAGLQSYKSLKGRDRAIYNVLKEAISNSGGGGGPLPFAMDIGMVTMREEGHCSVSRYNEVTDFDPFEKDFTFKGLSCSESIPLADEEIVPEEFFAEADYDDETQDWSQTGNAGVFAERWYHNGAICLWPLPSPVRKRKRQQKTNK